MTDEQAENIMEFLFAAHPFIAEKMPAITLNLYLAYIKTLPYEVGQAAALKIIKNITYFPKIAEINEAVQSFVKPENEIPTAEVAWEEVRKKLDPFKAVKWSHPLIARVVHLLGVRNLCFSETPGADMARFMKIYDTYRKQELNAIENESIIKITANIVKALPECNKTFPVKKV